MSECRDCRFFRSATAEAERGEGAAGSCRRRAPVLMRGYFDRQARCEVPDRAGWPPVAAGDGCGDFRPVQDTQAGEGVRP